MAGLVVDEVSIVYDGQVVLDRFSLDVAPGEVVAVVGPSGSGKSTLLRAIAGLEPLASGRVVLGDRDLGPVPTHHRGLGLMFQDHGLFTHRDVAGNIAYGLELAGVRGRRQAERTAELLSLVGLEGLGERAVDQLSGGEAQRVALARALAPTPDLLMLDEPLGSLDRALREQLTEELRRLLGRLDQMALHVTHDQGEAFALADRVAVIAGGRLMALDRPDRLWADPGSVFVARFLGHPNIWTVTVDADGRVRAGDVSIGRVDRGHPLRHDGARSVMAVLPATAVDLARSVGSRDEVTSDRVGGDPGPSQEVSTVGARVEEVGFDRGRWRVRARLDGAGAAHGDAGLVVDFETTRSVEVGARHRLRLDLGQLRPLTP